LDKLEVSVDEQVMIFISRHRPLTHDLRMALMASHISRDLERVADLTTSVARFAKVLNAMPFWRPVDPLLHLAQMSMSMVREAVHCFVGSLDQEARAMIPRDKEIDLMQKKLHEELLDVVEADRQGARAAVQWILIARSLERIGDHGKGIAESVFYLANCVDIRHTHGGEHDSAH